MLMNIELLCRFIKNNFSQLKNKQQALHFLKHQIELVAWHRSKLKLGAIVFDIKEFKFHTMVMWEEVEIRYIRQDTSGADEQKIENVLKKLGWHWDLRNYIALFVVTINLIFYLYYCVKLFYQKHLPTIAFRSEHYDEVLKHGFELSFLSPTFGCTQTASAQNYWLVELLTEFCSYFHLIF